MAKNIEPHLKQIGRYLELEKNKCFLIPEYQRSYSWTITQCDKLWQDIEGYIDSGAEDPYFFGTIIVDCSTQDKLCLIDGQQRTINFLLFLKAILFRLNEVIDSMPDDDCVKPLSVDLQHKRRNIMKILFKAEPGEAHSMLADNSRTHNILILENKSINELYREEFKKIIEAGSYDKAERNVFKIPRKQKNNKYTNYFRNFSYYYLRLKELNESNLNKFAKIFLERCQIIEIRSWQIEQAITMFNSLNSTGMPLSDADIISAQLYSNAGNNKKKFNERWEEINILTNKLFNHKIVSIDAVFQQFMYINRALNNEADVTTPGLRRYYTEIKKDLLDDPITLCDNILKIAKTWETIEPYPIVKLLLKFNENAKLFLASYLYRYELDTFTNTQKKEEIVTEICECLLRLFAVLELVDMGYSSSKFKSFLFNENIKFVDKNISIDTIKKDFKNHISNNWKFEEIYDIIYSNEKNSFVFLNEYLYASNKGETFSFTDNVNIEHIMPSSGKNIRIIQRDAGITDDKKFNFLVNKLGNKILLEENINKSIGNEWFKTKKQTSIKEKLGYKDSNYKIASSLTSYKSDVWGKDDIEEATKKATERITQFIFKD